MANSHGLTSRIVKKQAAARKQAKNKKAAYQVYIGNENPQSRKNMSYKSRTHYFENKQNLSLKEELEQITKNIEHSDIPERLPIPKF